MKHTPGPWLASKAYGLQGMIESEKYSIAATCAYCSPEEREANTKLIAAAPDLLEALKKIHGRNSMAAMSGYIDRETIEKLFEANGDAWEAIKKAEGET